MEVTKERKLWRGNKILYAEIAHQYPDCEIPVECKCGVAWESDSYTFGCWNCGFVLDETETDTAEQALLTAAGEGDAEASKKAFDGEVNRG